jgi:beta-glucuronidase
VELWRHACEVSLIEVPERFIDQYDLYLERGTGSVLAGWVHVALGQAGQKVELEIPELGARTSATTGQDGRAPIRLAAKGLERWSPEAPKLDGVTLRVGAERLDELMGFRTIETQGTEILLNGKPIFLRGVSISAEAP